MMKTNNLRNEIKEFIKDFCLEITNETVDIADCFEYENVAYYIPEDTSLMTEDDQLLMFMLIQSFPIADE